MNFLSYLKEIEKYTEENFPTFGINKKREIIRLLFEISKRENISFRKVISGIKKNDYDKIKKLLVERRYPNFKGKIDNLRLYLPAVKIIPEYQFKPGYQLNFIPRCIYVEKSVGRSYIVERFKKIFPEAKIIMIDLLKKFMINKKFGIADYNKRRNNIFVVREKYDFFKKCPCTKGAVSCGYNIFNLGLGCIYECVYCYLQLYLKNNPGIIIPANLDDFFKKFPFRYTNSPLFRKPRLGSGEFNDSLALDNITGWSVELIEFFRKRPQILFEFKTKSKNVNNLLKTKPAKNIVVSWSLNPQKIIEAFEFYTASLEERVFSAKICAEYGYRIGLHLDPVIYYKNWEEDYRNLINIFLKQIPKKNINWISLGTLRFNPELKKIIEIRFPDNKILDNELFLDFDNKLRYEPKLRIMIYKKILFWLKKMGKGIPVYLCMENRDVWRDVYGN